MENDADTFDQLMIMAEDVHLRSRNHNDEVIGIEFYNNLSVLSDDERQTLIDAWQDKHRTCVKERLASQWMVIQVMLLTGLAMWIAWMSGGIAGALVSIAGIIGIIAMIEDKRVQIAKRNLEDCEAVLAALQAASQEP